jgi:hypothetical protein
MRGAACVGMLATVFGKMKAVQKIASADGLTLVAERGLTVVADIWIERFRQHIEHLRLLRGGFLQQEGRPVFRRYYAFASPPAFRPIALVGSPALRNGALP